MDNQFLFVVILLLLHSLRFINLPKTINLVRYILKKKIAIFKEIKVEYTFFLNGWIKKI